MITLARTAPTGQELRQADGQAASPLRPVPDSDFRPREGGVFPLEWRWPMVGGIPDLPAEIQSPGIARCAVSSMLSDWGLSVLIPTAVLITSELVTNSVKALVDPDTADEDHPHGWPRTIDGKAATVGLRLCSHDEYLLIEVSDPDDGMPVLKEADPDAESGRGLAMVKSLSEDWGWERRNKRGKVTWALLKMPKDSPGSEGAPPAAHREVRADRGDDPHAVSAVGREVPGTPRREARYAGRHRAAAPLRRTADP